MQQEHETHKADKMTVKSSAKLYLTIFLMTTCIYMVLYQYHLSGTQILSSDANTAELKVVSKFQNRLVKRHELEQQEQQEQLQQQHAFRHQQQTDQQQQQEQQHSADNERMFRSDLENSFDTEIDSSRTVVVTSSSSSSTSTKFLSTATATSTVTTTTSTKYALPPLYIITPTYKRPEQLAEITRLGYTLKHVSNLLWLVIEDSATHSELVTKKLQHVGVNFIHLIAPMPQQYRKNKAMPRGVSNRNRGLEWLRANATEGVFYFADDDNTYDISIFEQMRYTKKVSMWPVGLVTKLGVSSPIVRNGKFEGFYDGWIGGRKFPVDMAGFAVSVKFLLERPDAKMPYKAGYEEDGFLKSLQPFNNTEIELLASDCTEVLTWHTQSKKNPVAAKLNMTKYGDTNLVRLSESLVGAKT